MKSFIQVAPFTPEDEAIWGRHLHRKGYLQAFCLAKISGNTDRRDAELMLHAQRNRGQWCLGVSCRYPEDLIIFRRVSPGLFQPWFS